MEIQNLDVEEIEFHQLGEINGGDIFGAIGSWLHDYFCPDHGKLNSYEQSSGSKAMHTALH